MPPPYALESARLERGAARLIRQLIRVRQSNAALQYGDVTVLGDRLAGNALVFLRHANPGEAALVVVNLSDQPLEQVLLLPYSLVRRRPLRDALGQAPDIRVQAASVRLQLAPHSCAVYEAFEPTPTTAFSNRATARNLPLRRWAPAPWAWAVVPDRDSRD